MKQGFEAVEFRLDNKKSNKATQVLKVPIALLDKNQNITSNAPEKVEIPLQGVNYGMIGDLEEILNYLSSNNQSYFVADHDFMGQKMNISVHISELVTELILDNKVVVNQTNIYDKTNQNIVNVILNVVPKQYEMSNEGLSFDTQQEKISFKDLEIEIKNRLINNMIL